MMRTPSTGPGKESDYFSLRNRQQSLTGAGPDENASTVGPGTPKPDLVPPPTPSTPSGLMGRLKSFGKITRRPVSDASPTLGASVPTEVLAIEVCFLFVIFWGEY
jgi:WD repeat-containing protein 48